MVMWPYHHLMEGLLVELEMFILDEVTNHFLNFGKSQHRFLVLYTT